jgi:hypothetical protein
MINDALLVLGAAAALACAAPGSHAPTNPNRLGPYASLGAAG